MKRMFALTLAALLCLALLAAPALAASGPTDEILDYEITADVLDDGTVFLTYHIDWKVLRDDIGALEWITVGIPNSEYVRFAWYKDTPISDMNYSSDGGSSLRIDFDRAYYAGETVSIDFELEQDYMYQMNLFEDGKTAYVFTPGWFDEITVDQLTVRWNNADLASWSPDCLVKDGYNVWETSLAPGETFTVTLNYPNDARNFSEEKAIYEPGDRSGGYDYNYDYDDGDDTGDMIAGIIFLLLFIGLPIWLVRRVRNKYNNTAKFGGSTQPKITRTKVVYYPVCQGCGAPRGDGETVCAHCGRSFVKNEETIKEENVPEADKEALKYRTKGEYRYSSSPDTFVRVNVVHVPVVHSCVSHSSGGSSRSSGGGSRGGGGCAHSSCACACASCACACACACAGGGRAGCTYKDFYRTDLKLKQLALKRKK